MLSPTGFCVSGLLSQGVLLMVIHFEGDRESTTCGLLGFLLLYIIIQMLFWLLALAINLHQLLNELKHNIGNHRKYVISLILGKKYFSG